MPRARSSVADDLSTCEQVRKRRESALRYWGPRRVSMARLDAFLSGDRYEPDQGPENKDRRLTQIRGQETQDTIRHVTAEATNKPRSVEARPIDHDTDPDQAEVEAALVAQELENPWKGFEDCYYEAVMAARSRRLGIVWADWDPDSGRFGEILYSYERGERIMWDPAYHPHHPNCGWLIRERRLDVDWIHSHFKGSDWVQPDRMAFDEKGNLRVGIPLISGSDGRILIPDNLPDDNRATVWECWYKNDRTTYDRQKPGSDEPLPRDQWYMACSSGCGYRSEMQGAIADMTPGEAPDALHQNLAESYVQTGEIPETMGGCPRCSEQGQQGTLERVDTKYEQESVLAYSRGKRLVIMAPLSPAPEDKPLYDGKWPVPSARSFPGLFITSSVRPGEPIGPCDVDHMWDQQVASDNLRTIALQRVFEHRNYWIMPKVGITDFRSKRFEFREDQYNIMFRDASLQPDQTRVDMLNGTGLDPGWSIAFNAIQAALTQYRGVADFGLTPESTKDIAVGTVQTIERQGNIPILDFKRRCNRELSKFYGVVSDYIHATYTPARVSRLRIDGIDLVVGLWGQDMPNYDFVVEEAPDFTGLEKARSEAFQALMGVYTNAVQLGFDPAAMVEIFADVNNLPRSVVRKFEKMLQDQADRKAEAQAQAEQMGGMGAGGTQSDLMAALSGGGGGSQDQLNGGGMVPAPAA